LTIGFIGFGEVASEFSAILLENGCEVVSSSLGRSSKTKKLIVDLGVNDLKDFKEVAKCSDILISVVSPSNAINIGKKYGKIVKGVFIDLNNISPNTTKEIAESIGEDKFVDGGIIGKAGSKTSIIYASGKNADKIAILNKFGLKVKVISYNIGDVSTLKMLRSMYTKSISAVLIETFEVAEKIGLSDELLDTIAITEGKLFKSSAKSRIENSIKHSNRKYEEVDEILDFLNSYENILDKEFINNSMILAVKNKFKLLKG
jgi:3-hydroxyisobutyrate dehydrogenase-like beta-hydroxyacid dehydrogenase